MALNLAALTYETRAASVDFGEAGALEVTWAPGKLTSATQSEMVAGFEKQDAMIIATLLAAILVSWDLENDGIPAPITVDYLGSLPLEVVGKIFAKIGEATTVGEANGAT